MSLLAALILGLVQGLTEFFPISSSAHLQLTRMLLKIENTSVMFDLACHLGTLGALILFLKKEIWYLILKDKIKLIYFFIALLPLIPCYFFLSFFRELVGKPEVLGFFLMVTGGILLLGQNVRLKINNSRLRDVLLIGAMQSAALIPGISRSASTISTARVLGWDMRDSVRFSFLLGIPTILGGNLLEAKKLWKAGQIVEIVSIPCLVGFFTALIVGRFVIGFAINWLERGKLQAFAWYCLTIGMIVNLYNVLK